MILSVPKFLGCVDNGRDPFNQNFWKCRSKTQWIGSVQPEKFWKNWSTFSGGPLFPVGPVECLVEWIAPNQIFLPMVLPFARESSAIIMMNKWMKITLVPKWVSTRSVLGVRSGTSWRILGTVGKDSRNRSKWLPSISWFQTLHKRTAYFIMATEENTEVLYNLNLFIVV